MLHFQRVLRCAFGVLGISTAVWCTWATAGQAQVAHRVPLSALAATNEDIAELIATAVPMELVREGLGDAPMPQSLPISPSASEGRMRIHPGHPGRPFRQRSRSDMFIAPHDEAAPPGANAAPLDFGQGNRNSIYHFSDYLLTPYPVRVYPYRAAGKLFFTLHGFNFVCTAALISSSIIVTAGHCLNDGDGTFASRAVFVPAYSASTPIDLFGRCSVTHMWTTPEWNSGLGLAFEHDVAVALCGRAEHPGPRGGRLIGQATGWLGFCYRNCRMPYVMDTQIGYPVNYYGGGEMTISQHLAETVSGVIGGYRTGAYVHGTAMTGGSSGGPHIMNAGEIDPDSVQGRLPDRNVTLAVTSFSVGGAPGMLASVALTGTNNSIGFRRMFNLACRESRRVHGNRSCDPIR